MYNKHKFLGTGVVQKYAYLHLGVMNKDGVLLSLCEWPDVDYDAWSGAIGSNMHSVQKNCRWCIRVWKIKYAEFNKDNE